MKLDTITMEKEAAEQAFAEHRDAVRSEKRGTVNEVRREYEALDRAIMRGYKEIAKGRQLLKLSEAIRAGGTITKTWDASYWQRDNEALDRAIMRGYKEIAKGRQLLKLSEAIRAGGTITKTWDASYWQRDKGT